MAADPETQSELCNCLALRRAMRHVSQFYDQHLASSGLRSTQYSILARLRRTGPMTINALAAALVTDRTTLGRNILPLQREGLLDILPGKSDRRRKELHLTAAGLARLRRAGRGWAQAQARFEAVIGEAPTVTLRNLLNGVAASDFGGA